MLLHSLGSFLFPPLKSYVTIVNHFLRFPLYRLFVGVSTLSGLLTVSLFLYILMIPVIKGIPPNVRANHIVSLENFE
jgi:hypothetical protein